MKLSGEAFETWKGKYSKNKQNYYEKKKKNLALNVATKSLSESENLFIGDTGASCHMTHSDAGMFDCEEINETVTIGNGHEIKATKIGKKRIKIIQENGKEIIGLLENVKYVPKLAPYNLFSITTAIKEMKRVIKYVLTIKNQTLKVELTPMSQDEMWSMTAFSDSNYVTDPENWRSITGFVLYLMGVPISWKLKGQKSVSLSSTEAEYIALSETAKEVRFVYQVLEFIGFKVKLPIVIRVDNVGAIFE